MSAKCFKITDYFVGAFNENDIESYEKRVIENPDVTFGGIMKLSVSDYLPFLKRVLPVFSDCQNSYGFTIISLDNEVKHQKEVIEYGLRRLLLTEILTQRDVDRIISWYSHTKSTHTMSRLKDFSKEFEIGGVSYEIFTIRCGIYRDVIVLALTQKVIKAIHLLKT